MFASSLSTPAYCRRSHTDYYIEEWLKDQQELETPSLTQPNMSDTQTQPQAGASRRQGSPLKRQRPSESNSDTQWDNTSLSIFTETSTGFSTSRASSPTKGIRARQAQLSYTNPAIFFGPPEPPVEGEISKNSDSTTQINEIPPNISALIRRLSEETADPVLPSDIISRINKVSPAESFCEPKVAEISHSKITPLELFRHISGLFEAARKLYAKPHDESAWYPLVHTILTGPPGTTSSKPFITVEEAQTKVICSDLLPTRNNTPIPAVKIDHVLQFNPEHGLISPLYQPVFKSQSPSFSLSAFNDPVAANTFTCAIIEVKSPGGTLQEASYQTAIASAAILQRITLLGGGANNGGDLMPVIGWVVYSHFWTLHVTYQQVDGSIRVLGPYPAGNTVTYLGLYRLLRIVEEVKLWGEETYFPYLLTKLAGLQ